MLWIPGPTQVRPEILAECARAVIGHRTAEMSATIERLDPGLKLAFGLAAGSSSQVAVHTASATALMEASLIGAGERVLCVVNGAFSKRWLQIAQALGKDATALEVPLGQPADLGRLAARLAKGPAFDAVTFVSSETSTGTLTPLAGVTEVLSAHPETLLLCDLVSYVAGAPVDFDAHRLDFGFGGVQKAFALPPGIAVACVSQRYIERARRQPRRSFYLDPIRILDGHAARKTPITPCIPLYFALARQLEDITSGATLPDADRGRSGPDAWAARFAKHDRMRARTLAWADEQGLGSFPEPRYGSPTVSCLRAGTLDAGALVAGLKTRGFEISNGYGDLKGGTFRIGHMGDHTEDGLEQLLSAASEVLDGLRG